VIVWLNGPYGAGKTSVADEIRRIVPDVTVFDPEVVGEMLVRIVDVPTGDFQDLPAWRRLVTATARELLSQDRTALVAHMTVLRRPYLDETVHALQRNGVEVFHVLLDVAPGELRRRIESADPQLDAESRARRQRWRLDHVAAYLAATDCLRDTADLVLDTTGRSPAEVALRVVRRSGLGMVDRAPFATTDADR
jgi:AAA domain